MQSGVGDELELQTVGIPVVQHLPGVGQNLQDHVAFDCVWEFEDMLPPRNSMCEAFVLGKTSPDLSSPDTFMWQTEVPLATPEVIAQFGVPSMGWSIRCAIAHPKSRGRLRLTGPQPEHPISIEANTFGEPDDYAAAKNVIQLCREIGNSTPLRDFVGREALPGELSDEGFDTFIRNAATTYYHQTGTAKMGRDAMSVVDGELRVYGIDNLRIADGSIMPRITTTNTMAPCVVIAERAAEFLKAQHGL